ncbi:myxosortase-dependent M36 family metallopeptidase [Anaeromyxobacter oryzae]|uniref:PKD/Chitinase domain-containing protein n=1 Tax=Anaeromyxobacter oryzae TaxID=2918170 RepID=A0ABM7WNI6_9BACT|nr:myxosortase-dependent M36 family metallopeptidase [Anaeromyxobacter oryzae]BDG01028.1 hypothetical protein AMOR_00240 [Anaeromyxobacter oryzae]
MLERRVGSLLVASFVVLAACGQSTSAPQSSTTAAASSSSQPARASSGRPGDFNVLAAGKDRLGVPRVRAQIPEGTLRAPVHVDSRLGVPTFMWALGERAPAAIAGKAPRTPADAARAHLRGRAAAYGLAPEDVDAAVVTGVHDTGVGPVIVSFRQPIGGIEVFRETAKVAMDRRWNLVAISGNLSPASDPIAARATPAGGAFALGELDAIATALVDLTGETFAAGDLAASGRRGPYLEASLSPVLTAARAELFSRPARAKKVWFRLPGGLEPAYYVEVGLGRVESVESLEYGYVVSAVDGRVLFRKDQVDADAFKYRVWAESSAPYRPWDGPQGTAPSPHPTGVPDGYQAPFLPSRDVILSSAPFSRNDPWLAADATVTTGNNAEAYADISGADGFDASDIRGTASAPQEFAYPYGFDVAPNATMNQVQAAITQLFYDVNFFHDWYYDAGFDEASGNAQASNFGRGGLEGDSLKAEAQDSSGINNANMQTPADGSRPRMQMYLFSGNGAQYITINSPPTLATTDIAGVAAGFGAQSFTLTGDVVLADDGSGTRLGCNATWVNAAAVTGKIALVYRGTCGFAVKAKNAQLNGAAGVIIANNTTGVANMGGVDGTVTIPAVLIAKAYGDAMALEPPASVNVTIGRSNVLPRDGTLDNAIVAHEWGHYISNRLIGDAAGLSNNQGRSMGEGWGDFHALLLMVRAEDAGASANADWSGVYAAAGYVTSGDEWYGGPNQGYYFGIRRVPYSTNLTKDPLTFKHSANGNPIDSTSVPVLFDWDGTNNAEVHNAGEVWATMLWECYAALLNEPGLPFDQAQTRMKNYLVAAYKLTPSAPTFLEARDAVLAAAYATDPVDYQLFWKAFAKRGAGMGAVAADRYASDNGPVVESYAVGPDLQVAGVRFGAVTSGCDDGDAVLDAGETGTLTLTVKNTGDRALGPVTATIASTNGQIAFPGGATVTFPASGPLETVTGTVQVSLASATGIGQVPFTLTYPPEAALVADTAEFALRVNTDEVPAASASDDLEAEAFAWTPVADPAFAKTSLFERVALSPVSHAIHGPDVGATADVSLVSPPLQVSPGASLVVGFRHAWDFESDPVGTPGRAFYDGAVVEVSSDGGTTWLDVGAPLYAGGAISSYTGDTNPLATRPALVGTSTGWPTLQPASLDLGTTYGGQTVLLRFRIGTDGGVGFGGWLIDDVTVSGIGNTPFPILIADTRQCRNRPPVAVAGPAQAVDEGAAVALSAAASSDPDAGTTLSFQWTQLSGPAVTLTGAGTAAPSFTAPLVTADAQLVFQVTVSDGALSSTATTVVTVKNANHAPIASAGADFTVDEGGIATLVGSASSDPDGDPLTYQWTLASSVPALPDAVVGTGVAFLGSASADRAFVVPSVTADTVLTFELAVSDGATSSTATVHVTVKNVNRPPVAVAGVDFSVDERTQVALSAAGSSDPDGDALTYTWTRVSGPALDLVAATIAANGTAIFTAPEVAADADLVLRLTVSDGAASSTSDVTIHVRNLNRQPLANAGAAQTVDERTAVTLNGSASSDPDGEALAYEWVQISGPAATLSSATVAQPTFTAPSADLPTQDLVFQLTVRDPHGVADSATVKVTVTNVDHPKGGCASGGDAGLVGLLFLGMAALRRRALRARA